MKKTKEGDILIFPKYKRYWIALMVNPEDFEKGIDSIDVESTGLYAFGGMWYGNDPNSKSSFGKVIPIEGEFEIVGHISKSSDEIMKRLRK